MQNPRNASLLRPPIKVGADKPYCRALAPGATNIRQYFAPARFLQAEWVWSRPIRDPMCSRPVQFAGTPWNHGSIASLALKAAENRDDEFDIPA